MSLLDHCISISLCCLLSHYRIWNKLIDDFYLLECACLTIFSNIIMNRFTPNDTVNVRTVMFFYIRLFEIMSIFISSIMFKEASLMFHKSNTSPLRRVCYCQTLVKSIPLISIFVCLMSMSL